MLPIHHLREAMDWIAEELARSHNDKRNAENDHGIPSAEPVEEVIVPYARRTELTERVNHRIEHPLHEQNRRLIFASVAFEDDRHAERIYEEGDYLFSPIVSLFLFSLADRARRWCNVYSLSRSVY